MEPLLERLLDRLSRMSTAIGMLAVVAFASMLGTWIPQSVPIQDYVAEYGVFWARFIWDTGLGDVYKAPWFLGLLAILIGSVCACLGRNGPRIWAQVLGVRVLPSLAQAEKVKVGEGELVAGGFRRLGVVEGYEVWERGRLNRVGYFMVHGGVVGVAVAGLMTGLLGWRGNLNLRAGETDQVVLGWHGETPVPHFLPFKVRNDGFDIAFYGTGMPKGYATTLHVSGMAGQQDKNVNVQVNSPVHVGAYAFYQASFGDGGSGVKGMGVDVRTGAMVPFAGRIYEDASLPDQTRIQLLDGRINTVETGDDGVPHDIGPSVDYLVQPPDAAARQLRAYVEYPEVIGVSDGMRGSAVLYRPIEVRGYDRVLARLAGAPVKDDVAVRAAIAEEVKPLQGEAKLAEALRLWQVRKVLGELDIRYILEVKEFKPARYSGLMVAYDPGAWLFWPSGLLAVLGVTLMLGRRLVRVFVKGITGYVVSPHGRRVSDEAVRELKKDE